MFNSSGLASKIQSTLIASAVTQEDVERHCAECAEYGFNAAMVPPCWVRESVAALTGTPVRVASAVDFPLGVMTTAGRVHEARQLVELGAAEVDIAGLTGWLLSGRERDYRDDLAAVVDAIYPVPLKVMLELPLLPVALREQAIDLAVDAGVTWLKNASSGAVGIATPEDIGFLRERAPAGVHVKASGGIGSREQVLALLAAGAELVGSSAGVAIVDDQADLETPTY